MVQPLFLIIQAIYLTPSLILQDVLHIPGFQFNLISVNKLTHSLNCQFLFSHLSCIIQDVSTKKTIGHVHNNLYILQHDPSPSSSMPSLSTAFSVPAVNKVQNNNNLNDFFDLSHFRLGHPSAVVIDKLCMQFPYIRFNKHLACDSCQMAKQCKLHFPISITQSDKPFDLLHMAIWGPLHITSIQGHKYFLTMMTLVGIHGFT